MASEDHGLAPASAPAFRNAPPKAAAPVAMIHVRIPATIHKPGPEFEPVTFTPQGLPVGGNYDIETIAPNTAFEINEKEGLALVAKFAHLGAEVVIPAREERRAKAAAEAEAAAKKAG